MSRGLSLVGMLVSLAVIAIVFTVLYGTLGRNGPDPVATRPGGPTTRLAQSVEKGQEVACRNNLRQVRDALQMEIDGADEGAKPATVAAIAGKYGLVDEMLVCPVTRQPYVYDASTGKVRCPTPGHEAF